MVFVGSDERESGTLQMEELARLAGYQGNVAVMIGNLTDAGALQHQRRGAGGEQVPENEGGAEAECQLFTQ